MTTHTPRVFSGIKPSGGLTLGNYLGAIKRFVDMQGQAYETIYCVVDLHAITVWQDPAELTDATREVAAGYLAAGIDPTQSILFNQSQVSAHAELAWLFNCVARVGWMNRMTQFKDKAGKNAEKVSLGLYAYPSLMAADILLYHATHVPVGEDQKQHVELTRDIAQKFNHDFKAGEFFPSPEPIIDGPATRVMNLRDGSKKMSKSGESDMERINMTDDADTIAKKFKKAKTDPEPLPDTLDGLKDRPEARNLVEIYASLSNVTPEAVITEYAGAGWGKFKPALADLAVEKLAPISAEMARLMNDKGEIDRILGEGADKAEAIAQPILEKAYDITGFLRSRKR
ncbi:Tryptophan--tRNA ligase [Aliiroseovarius sp. xm-m-379]|uniref:tryptophan--tRNA ligase n=1 Tax=unclassified Aliiroseovarius TaxID=2623558 RepID=UPI001568543C|nr:MULTISPECIES: tryptophan--tRNA ligase [unclassified Aliiroseovarius]NRP14075.1 Tryptophan--tRNA ligase [Aliiroseovarius sp. xm-d-517]NRP23559.1 Tryptophan--tRNA ligase [Aliiroseovarius sp. xm-m-379]NRP29194.1 Tryptophan--tRNA ligase [Aliiroseovarius sp. xm-m-314]NRP32358.1 Tryptophan--tRNA ligase [Aliiroseovarius sp. xm-a-104]NRP40891.1 Tryptophan--tRNA ligase [Aliiroseovarius sp. xm-m-339-2]